MIKIGVTQLPAGVSQFLVRLCGEKVGCADSPWSPVGTPVTFDSSFANQTITSLLLWLYPYVDPYWEYSKSIYVGWPLVDGATYVILALDQVLQLYGAAPLPTLDYRNLEAIFA